MRIARSAALLLSIALAACAAEEKEPVAQPVLSDRLLELLSQPPGTSDYLAGKAGAARDAKTVEVYADEALAKLVGSRPVEADGSFKAIDLGDNAHARVWAVARAGDQRAAPLALDNDILAPPLVVRPESVVGPQASFTLDCGGESCERRFSLDGGAPGDCGPVLSFQELGPEPHELVVSASDEAGNVAEVRFAWEAPAVLLEEAPADPTNRPTASFFFGCSLEDCSFSCSVDGRAWEACTSPWAVEAAVERAYEVRIRAANRDGIVGFPVAHRWSHDATPPQLVIEAAPAGRTAETAVTIGFVCSGDCTTTCSLDGRSAPCEGAASYADLADGDHVFTLIGRDRAGNTADARVSWTIDTEPPALTLAGVPIGPTDRTWALVQPHCEAPCTLRCSLDDGTELPRCDEGLFLEGIEPGEHRLVVRAADDLGNEREDARTWTVSLPVFTAIDVGAAHVCAIDDQRRLHCWGENVAGPGVAQVQLPGSWTAVDAGWSSTCAIDENGALHCWGSNFFGQLGQGDLVDRAAPTRVGTARDWLAVSVGAGHACGIRAGTLWCWGQNGSGAIGDATYIDRPAPVQIGTDADWERIAAGGDHTCGLRAGGVLQCWGNGIHGQLGTTPARTASSPQTVPGNWIGVSAGALHTCANVFMGSSCWGDNSQGQVGPLPLARSLTPLATDWMQAVAGGYHSCGVALDGSIACAGANDAGQSGSNQLAVVQPPAQAAPRALWSRLAAGVSNSCALRADGSAWCWGSSASGQLRLGGTGASSVPLDAFRMRGIASVEAGVATTCGITGDGSRFCAGRNGGYELGDGGALSRTVARRADQRRWADLALGLGHGCGIDESGALFCWGTDRNQVLGLGNVLPAPTPWDESQSWVDVAAGEGHVCGVRDSGSLWCWGQNGSGEAGLGVGLGSTGTAMRVSGTGWSRVAAAHRLTCGLRDGGSAWCWGSWRGVEAGTLPGAEPTRVAAAYDDFVAIDPGNHHACGLRAGGELHCWGLGGDGQLGDGAATDALSEPVQVPGSWVAFAAGGRHTCAISTAGTLHCWGANDRGQAAAGALPSTAAPVQVGIASDWIGVTAGTDHTCAVRADGTVACWGENASGQLGEGTALRSTPVGIGLP